MAEPPGPEVADGPEDVEGGSADPPGAEAGSAGDGGDGGGGGGGFGGALLAEASLLMSLGTCRRRLPHATPRLSVADTATRRSEPAL